MIINLKNIIDETVGGKENSNKPISSGALYQTVNNPPSPSTWLKITALEKTSTRNYRQYLNYNPFTGIVQLYGSTPARIIDGNYSVVSYLVNGGTEIAISETASLDNVTITGEITDYTPQNDIHFVARGSGTYNNDSSTTMAFLTLQPDGKIFAKSITGGQLPKKIYDFNITYRCKLNYHDTQPS